MIEIPIPADIREYEPTVVGPLSARKLVAVVAMVAGVYAGYAIEKAVGIEDPMQLPIFLLLAIPPLLVGWVKPYGLYFEVFISKVIRDNILAPVNRPYIVENFYDTIAQEDEPEETQDKNTKKEKKAVTPRNKELRAYK